MTTRCLLENRSWLWFSPSRRLCGASASDIAGSEILERTIYGSDTPFPSNPLVFWNRLAPTKLLSLLSERNLFERNYRLQQALGLPAEVFLRGRKLLMHDGAEPI